MKLLSREFDNPNILHRRSKELMQIITDREYEVLGDHLEV